MQGWVKLHREVQTNVVWNSTTAEQKVIFMTLLMMVNHSANSWEWNGDKYHVQPGQTITSVQSICKLAGKGITPQKVKTALKKFEKWQILTDKATKQGRLITLLNWGKYQHQEQIATNELTIEQPTTNHQLTTNKNDKNVNNESIVSTPDNYSSSDKEPDPSLKEVISLYYKLLTEYTKQTPIQQWAKDFSILKKAAEGQIIAQGADKVKDKLKAWFKSADSFTRGKGYPLRLFVSQYNSIVDPDKDELTTYAGECFHCGELLVKGESHCRYCKRKAKRPPIEHRIIES